MREDVVEDQWSEAKTANYDSRDKAWVAWEPEPAVMDRDHIRHAMIERESKDVKHSKGAKAAHERRDDKAWECYRSG